MSAEPTTRKDRGIWDSFYKFNPDKIPAPTVERILRLIADVDRLEAENERLREQLDRQKPIVRQAQPRPYEDG